MPTPLVKKYLSLYPKLDKSSKCNFPDGKARLILFIKNFFTKPFRPNMAYYAIKEVHRISPYDEGVTADNLNEYFKFISNNSLNSL